MKLLHIFTGLTERRGPLSVIESRNFLLSPNDFTAGVFWKLRGEQSFQNNNILLFFSILIFTVWQCFKIHSGLPISFIRYIWGQILLNPSKIIGIYLYYLNFMSLDFLSHVDLIWLYNLFGIEIFHIFYFESSDHVWVSPFSNQKDKKFSIALVKV